MYITFVGCKMETYAMVLITSCLITLVPTVSNNCSKGRNEHNKFILKKQIKCKHEEFKS